jgi:hypothetical protein
LTKAPKSMWEKVASSTDDVRKTGCPKVEDSK